jgi:hypothetical protein
MIPQANTVNPGLKYMEIHLPQHLCSVFIPQKGAYAQKEKKKQSEVGERSIYKHRKGIMEKAKLIKKTERNYFSERKNISCP